MATWRWSSPVVIFAAALLFGSLSLAAPIALLMRPTTIEPEETARPAPTTVTRTSVPAAPAAAVRVSRSGGSAERLDTGGYRVTFAWLLEGAREGDPVVVRFLAGARQLTESRGALDSNVFTASTGELVLTTSQPCSAEGWSAELTSLRGQVPVGDAIARVAGAPCA